MKCASFASWLVLLTGTQAQETRPSLRAGRADKVGRNEAITKEYVENLIVKVSVAEQ